MEPTRTPYPLVSGTPVVLHVGMPHAATTAVGAALADRPSALVASAGPVVISDADLAAVDDRRIDAVLAELAGGDIRVVVLVQPFATSALERWQAALAAGAITPLSDWLGDGPAPTSRDDAEQVPELPDPASTVERWASAVGGERVIVAMTDTTSAVTTFEAAVELPPGTLTDPTGPPVAGPQRLLTFAESEVLRRFNEVLLERATTPTPALSGLVARRLATVDAIAPVDLPADVAVSPAHVAATTDAVARIRAAGAVELGPLARLIPGTSPTPTATGTPSYELAVDVAADLVHAMLLDRSSWLSAARRQ